MRLALPAQVFKYLLYRAIDNGLGMLTYLPCSIVAPSEDPYLRTYLGT